MRKSSQIGLVLSVLAAASMWCYVDFVLVPYQQKHSAALGIPRGNLSDLYPRWLGARELWLHGRNPYGNDVAREIQRGYYGRELDPSRVNDPKDQQGFAYPVYVSFLLAPIVRLPFDRVQTWFRWLLVGITALSIPLWLRAIRWKPSWLVVLTWICLGLGSYAAVQGIKLQQLSLLVCGFLAGSMAALVNGHFVIAGILLAVSTIKPQLAGILVSWLAVWTLSDWGARKGFAYSFIATMLTQIVGGELLLPGWISKFREAAKAYLQYTGGGKSVLDVALGPWIGAVAAIAVVGSVAVFCWRNRQAKAHESAFSWSLALVLAATLAVIPTYAPYNQLLLLPGLMLIVKHASKLWVQGKLRRLFILITGVCVFWSWIAAAALSMLFLFAPREGVERWWALPLLSSLWVPISVLGLTAMCASKDGLDSSAQATRSAS